MIKSDLFYNEIKKFAVKVIEACTVKDRKLLVQTLSDIMVFMEEASKEGVDYEE
jgi:hypothetical protein